jgi:hypothetical protein
MRCGEERRAKAGAEGEGVSKLYDMGCRVSVQSVYFAFDGRKDELFVLVAVVLG